MQPPSDLMSVAQPPSDLIGGNQPPPDLVTAPSAKPHDTRSFMERVNPPDPSTSKKLGTLASAADFALGVPAMATHFISTVGEAVKGGAASPWTGKGLKEVWSEASNRGNEAAAMWANPLERASHATGILEDEYKQSAPAQLMKGVGEATETGSKSLEEKTGIPSELTGTALEGLMLSMPLWFRERMAKPDAAARKAAAAERMKTAQPTGTAPPADLTEIPAVEKRMDTQPLPDDSTPIVKGRVADMRKRSSGLKPGEPIAAADEGDLSMMDSMKRSGYEPSPEASQEIHAALADPELSVRPEEGKAIFDAITQGMQRQVGERRIDPNRPLGGLVEDRRVAEKMRAAQAARTEAARDVAAERVAGAVKADRVKQAKRPAKQLSLVQTIKQMGGTSNSMLDVLGEKYAGKGKAGIPVGVFHANGHGLDDLATRLKDMGYDINTGDVDGGVQQLKDMIRAEVHGETQLPMEAAFDEFDRMYAGHWREGGKIDPKLLTGGAAVAGGAAVGAYLDDKDRIEGALAGAAGAFFAAKAGNMLYDKYGSGMSLRDAIDAIKPSIDPMRKMAADAMNKKDARIAAAYREVGGLQRAYMKAVSAARRKIIGKLHSAGIEADFTDVEKAYIALVDKMFAKIGSEAQQWGVIKHLLNREYVPLIWEMRDTRTKAFFDELFASGAGDKMSASDFTPFSLKRSTESYVAAPDWLKPLTTDHAELLGMYANSVIKAVENAKALYYLKTMKTPEGYAVMPVDKNMPRGYDTDHNIKGLEGFGVHPEMVEALKLGFDSYEPGIVGRAMRSVAFGAKRMILSYTLFHPTSELFGYIGTGGNPFGFLAGAAARGVEKGVKAVTGKDITNKLFMSAVDLAHEQLRTGGGGDMLDFGIRNGLTTDAAIEDTLGRENFYKLTGTIDKWLGTAGVGAAAGAYLNTNDRIKGALEGLGIGLGVMGLGKGLRGLGKAEGITDAISTPLTSADKALHAFTFGYTTTGMRMATFIRKFERELVNPKNAGKDVNQIAADVASFSNNIAGGQAWRRSIEAQNSAFGRAFAGDLLSKKGRTKLQIAMLAPDWAISTIRAWTQAVPGLSENARVGRLHREYLARSMLYTLAIGDAFNYHYSGHHIWENDFRTQQQKDKNEDPSFQDSIRFMTLIDMGDGTYVNPNKHLLEFIHAITDPPHFVAGKLSPLISEPIVAGMNKQWMPTKGHWVPDITPGGTATEQTQDYLTWLFKQNLPISLQQANSANFGIIGLPRSGLTDEKRDQLREQARDIKEERGL